MVPLTSVPWQTINITNRVQKLENLEDSIKMGSGKNDSKDIREACAEFESIFISFIMKTMRDTIPESGLLNGGMVEEVYTSMLDQELARKMAERGGIGLSSLLLSQLEKGTNL